MTTESSVPASVLRSEQRDGSATTEDCGVPRTSGPEATSLQGNVRVLLKGDASLPRRLHIELDRKHGYFTAHVLSKRCLTVAFASEKLTECRLDDYAGGQHRLWVHLTAFGVTPAEAATIHEKFAPLGLNSKFVP